MDNPFIIKGDAKHEMATFRFEQDARTYVGTLAATGDWRGFKTISIWHNGCGFYVADRGLTHFT